MKLIYTQQSGYENISKDKLDDIFVYNNGYKAFIDSGKTERDCVNECITLASSKGFKPFVRGSKLVPGDKVYVTSYDKTIILAIIGKKNISQGCKISAAHIDCPRLDLKPNPLYEDSDIALLKTHYYGGIKKFQWLARPLAIVGVVYTNDGNCVNINIGNDASDPVFVITDLLPHLASDQMKKSVSDAFSGESLNAIVGTIPYNSQDDSQDDCKDKVKLAVLQYLNEKYGIIEQDFISAELSLVPAENARDVGFDRSLIGGYGHDDRSCSYASLRAIVEINDPEYTSICMLADKEEIGSEGVTGMQSCFFDSFMQDLCDTQNVPLRYCYENSLCLSADVSNAFDPNYPEVSEKRNNARIGYGMSICKYTGRGGKSGSSDASAQTIAKVRKLLDDNNIMWQMSELGKVDQGGGGTVAAYMARRNIEVIDTGVPVLSMHAPFEVISKFDNFMAYKGFLALFNMV